jgi:hypothetical protein
LKFLLLSRGLRENIPPPSPLGGGDLRMSFRR